MKNTDLENARTSTDKDVLVDIRNRASIAYYKGEELLLSDGEFDRLLERLEEEFGVAPITGHGFTVSEGKISREIPLQSLRKITSTGELLGFLSSVDNASVSVEPKADGLSISIRYEDGKIVEASTRGNGYVGEDVTEAAKRIANGALADVGEGFSLEVRGEVVFPFDTHETIKDHGYEAPRNAASGVIRRKEPSPVLPLLSISIWEVIDASGKSHFTEELPVALEPFRILSEPRPIVVEPAEDYEAIRDITPYEIDGLVYKVNSIAVRDELGSNASDLPLWAIAYKPADEAKDTVLRDIIWQAKRGKITPVAVFDPVFLGRNVDRATLHNISKLEELDAAIGDTISVKLSKMVIPQVVEVVSRPKDRVPYAMPEGIEYRREGKYLVPSERQTEAFVQYALDRLDVKGVGPAFVSDVVKEYGVEDFSDLFRLLPGDIEALPEGYKETKANKIYEAIQGVNNYATEADILASFGLHGFGFRRSQKILEEFGTIDELLQAKESETFDDQGHSDFYARIVSALGEASGEKFYNDLPVVQELSSKYTKAGIVPVVIEKEDSGKNNPRIEGKRFAISGALPTLKRAGAEAFVIENGGTVGSIVKDTDIAVFGEKASASKVAKAENLGIEIISGETFESWLPAK